MRLAIFFLPLLVACGGDDDINGVYAASHTRSDTCGGSAPLATQIEIVDTPNQHVARVLGDAACIINFTVTDYGGVGVVDGVEPGCAFQPQGFTFSTGDFSPYGISITWTSGTSCTVTDHWKLTRSD